MEKTFVIQISRHLSCKGHKFRYNEKVRSEYPCAKQTTGTNSVCILFPPLKQPSMKGPLQFRWRVCERYIEIQCGTRWGLIQTHSSTEGNQIWCSCVKTLICLGTISTSYFPREVSINTDSSLPLWIIQSISIGMPPRKEEITVTFSQRSILQSQRQLTYLLLSISFIHLLKSRWMRS